MFKYIILIMYLAVYLSPLSAQNSSKQDGSKLLNKVAFYTALQKEIPMGWKLAVRGDIYVVYYDNTYIMTDADYGKMPKENEGKEETWIRKNGHSLSYEIIISFEDCYTEYATPTIVGISSQTTLDAVGEKYGVATQVLTPKAAASADANKLIPDPVTGLFFATSNEERNRLAMFALSRELLQQVPATAVQMPNTCNVSDTQTDKKYTAKLRYNTDYRKIFPERIATDTENIANKIKIILTPR